MASEWLSIRGFADTLNVSEGLVRKAIRQGKFVKGWDASTKKINAKEAEEDNWVQSQKEIKKNGISKTKLLEKLEKGKTKLAQKTVKKGAASASGKAKGNEKQFAHLEDKVSKEGQGGVGNAGAKTSKGQRAAGNTQGAAKDTQANARAKQANAKDKQGNARNKQDTTKDTQAGAAREQGGDGVDEMERESVLLNTLKITTSMRMDEAMRVNELISAELARLKLLEAERVLVRREKVEKVLYGLGSQLKKSISKLPEMIIDDLLAASNRVEAINIMKGAINEVLTSYANFDRIELNDD
jgi:hypothetical protein